MNDESKNCILTAKKEFTSILVYHLYPSIYQGIKSIWNSVKNDVTPRKVFEEFQIRLSRVRKWNQDIIESEYDRIIHKNKCTWLENLIRKIFILNTQILAATSVDANRKIKVKIPVGSKFIHCCYKECARAFYENPLYMEDRDSTISRVEQCKNLQKSYKLIMTCIENAIRNLLPIESLLDDNFIAKPDDEGEDATPIPELYKNIAPFRVHDDGNIEIQHKDNTIPTITVKLQDPEDDFFTRFNKIQEQREQEEQGQISEHEHESRNSGDSEVAAQEDATYIPIVANIKEDLDLNVDDFKNKLHTVPNLDKFDSVSFFSDAED
jgi:hypothetical protein